MSDELDGLTDVLSALPDIIGDDETMRTLLGERVAELINTTFDMVEDMLLTGDRQTQISLIKTLLPQMLKVKNATEVNTDEMLKAKLEVLDLFVQMGSGFAGAGVAEDEDDGDEDLAEYEAL